MPPTQTPNTDSHEGGAEHDLAVSTDAANQEVTHPLPTNPETDCQESPLAGLVFGYRDQDDESLWQIGICGELANLSTQSNVQISPGGDQALYTLDGDIWIIDLLNGSKRNLTNTAGRTEAHPQWWPGRDSTVVFGSWGSEDDLGPTTGYLSLVSADGSNYRVVENQSSNAHPSPQPNGQMIAYDLGDTAWLYHLNVDEVELFDVSLYGLNIHKGMKIGSPSWSPDGKMLAWWVGGVFSPPIDGSVALAVFDLEAMSVSLLHPYTPIGMGGWFPAPIWSPDGKWLAIATLSEAYKSDLWVCRADGWEEHRLGFGANPVWHPHSGSLAFTSISENVIKWVEVGDWKLRTIDLPPGSVPVGWHGIIRDFSTESQSATTDTDPSFGPEIHFAANPEIAGSHSVFPYGTPAIFTIWSYRNMQAGLTIRSEWYLDGGRWMVQEEPWDYAKYGSDGFVTDFSVYDFDQGLEPGRYQLRLYIDDKEQSLGHGGEFSSAFFEISAPIDISPQISPDFSQAAIVEPPGTLIIQDVASQDQIPLLAVDEISSLAWYPDGKYILFSVRDRSSQQMQDGSPGVMDELWVVNLETGESYPFQDQYGQTTGTNLHDPYISPDGLYVAAIEGSGWADACYVDRQLWVKEIGFSGDRLQEVFSYYQLGFTITPAPENGEMYVERIIGWDSLTHLKVEFGWTCTPDNPAGIYLLDISTLNAEKIGESE